MKKTDTKISLNQSLQKETLILGKNVLLGNSASINWFRIK